MLIFGKSYKSILIFTIITVFLFTLPAFAEVCYPGGTESKEITNPITPIVGAKINCDWDENGVGFCRVVDYQLEVCEKTNNNFIGEVVSIDFVSQNENGVTLADLYEKCDRSPAQTSWCSGIFHEEWSAEGQNTYDIPAGESRVIPGEACVHDSGDCSDFECKNKASKIRIKVTYEKCCPDGYDYDVRNDRCKPEKRCEDIKYKSECKYPCVWCDPTKTSGDYCRASEDECGCYETDNGDNPGKAGICVDRLGTYVDRCMGDETLYEFYCDNGLCTPTEHTCECQNTKVYFNKKVYEDVGVCPCKKDGEPCKRSSECCGGFCYGTPTSKEYTCHNECGKYVYGADSSACCGKMDESGFCLPTEGGECSAYKNKLTCTMNGCKWCTLRILTARPTHAVITETTIEMETWI